MKLTSRELTQIRAALSLWAEELQEDEEMFENLSGFGHFTEHSPMTVAEVDDLYERLAAYEADASEVRKKLAECLQECPCCKSTNISGDRLDCEGFEAWQECGCNDCSSRWNEVYEFNRIDDIRDHHTKEQT